MGKIVVLDSDDFSRARLADILGRAGFDQACSVQSAPGDDEEGAVYLCIGEQDEKGLQILENDRFARPVRVGALLDRLQKHMAGADKSPSGEKQVIGPYTLDPESSSLIHKKTGEEVRLTDKEKHILEFLARHDGGIVERRALLDEVWGYAENVETHTLETHIYRLRQKIEDDPAAPQILVTEDHGYRLKAAD